MLYLVSSSTPDGSCRWLLWVTVVFEDGARGSRNVARIQKTVHVVRHQQRWRYLAKRVPGSQHEDGHEDDGSGYMC